MQIYGHVLLNCFRQSHWEFLPFRFWVGVWVAILLFILVATDASALVGLITRFTEEAFATLISAVFIIQAFQKLYEIGYEAPITIHPEEVLSSTCHCRLEINDDNGTTYSKNLSVGVTRCHELGGTPEGLQCFFKPDVYMFSVVLTFGTFTIAYALNKFRVSSFFSSKVTPFRPHRIHGNASDSQYRLRFRCFHCHRSNDPPHPSHRTRSPQPQGAVLASPDPGSGMDR